MDSRELQLQSYEARLFNILAEQFHLSMATKRLLQSGVSEEELQEARRRAEERLSAVERHARAFELLKSRERVHTPAL